MPPNDKNFHFFCQNNGISSEEHKFLNFVYFCDRQWAYWALSVAFLEKLQTHLPDAMTVICSVYCDEHFGNKVNLIETFHFSSKLNKLNLMKPICVIAYIHCQIAS